MNNLRNHLNNSYYHIRPVLAEAVRNAIDAVDQNDEEHVIDHLYNLITCFASYRHADFDSIENYLNMVSPLSVTRQFFEPFVQEFYDDMPPLIDANEADIANPPQQGEIPYVLVDQMMPFPLQ